jgi:cation/acetate symporter
VVVVGLLMMVYVTFGGMTATTWVQIIKACLLLGGGITLMLLTLAQFGWSFENLFTKAIESHKMGEKLMSPGSLMADPISAFSLSLGLLFGTAGLPHIMMRFFTVPNAKEARKSVFYATGFIGLFFLVTMVLGAAAITIVGTNPAFFEGGVVGGKLIGGGNMPVMHLAKAVGGDIFLGFLSAVAFATILAVVSGLALAGASAISHDLYARVIKKGTATSAAGNEGYPSGLRRPRHHRHPARHRLQGSERAVPGRAGFRRRLLGQLPGPDPVHVLEGPDHPRRAVGRYCRSGFVGGPGVLSPTVWVKILGNKAAIFPYDHPAIVSMTLAFFVTWLLSVTDKSVRATKEKEAYEEQYIRAQTGLGASGAHDH